jgi:divalent metal cation (Fe/Co/Zn/Cd) transporter
MKVAKERQSPTLTSNAIHHRMDGLGGMFAVLAIIGSNLTDSAGWVDPLGGLITCILVVYAGTRNVVRSMFKTPVRT